MMKTIAKYAGYAISVVFLYLTFRGVDYERLVDNFAYVDVTLLAVALIVNVGFFSLRAMYQNSNLEYLKRDISFPDSITAIAKAQFYNVFLPARIGDVLRVFFCPRERGWAKHHFYRTSLSRNSLT